MDGADPRAGALLTAFNALIEVAPPERVVPVLREAMLTLLRSEEPPPEGGAEHPEVVPAPVSKPRSARVARREAAVAPGQSRGQRAGGMEAWLPLRDRVRAEMATRGIKHAAIAAELGITEHTLRAMLGKHVPGVATVEKMRAWLAAQRETESADSPDADAAEGDAARVAHKLNPAEREQLAAWRELENAQTLRTGTGVAIDVLDQAIAGGSLDPGIISRLTQFLRQPLPARC